MNCEKKVTLSASLAADVGASVEQEYCFEQGIVFTEEQLRNFEIGPCVVIDGIVMRFGREVGKAEDHLFPVEAETS